LARLIILYVRFTKYFDAVSKQQNRSKGLPPQTGATGRPAGDELNCKIYIGPFEIFLMQEAGGIRINYGTQFAIEIHSETMLNKQHSLVFTN
jgi:hypothetical protein